VRARQALCPSRLRYRPIHFASLQAFPDFNKTPFDDTEKMIQFHIHAANIQLRQAYYGFIAALGLERVLVMPRVSFTPPVFICSCFHSFRSTDDQIALVNDSSLQFQCFCAKNWYMTQSCRINGEHHTQFPYSCALSHVMRVKKLLHGGMTVEPGKRPVAIREHTFMDNPNVPEEIKVW